MVKARPELPPRVTPPRHEAGCNDVGEVVPVGRMVANGVHAIPCLVLVEPVTPTGGLAYIVGVYPSHKT